jgi:hypothetical protein
MDYSAPHSGVRKGKRHNGQAKAGLLEAAIVALASLPSDIPQHIASATVWLGPDGEPRVFVNGFCPVTMGHPKPFE